MPRQSAKLRSVVMCVLARGDRSRERNGACGTGRCDAMTELAEILNRHWFYERLRAHWARVVVLDVAEVLFWQDPAGLRGFPCLPRNEYEPEALWLVADCCRASGDDLERFWSLGEEEGLRLLWAADEAAVLELLRRRFAALSGAWVEAFDWRSCARSVAAALRRCGGRDLGRGG